MGCRGFYVPFEFALAAERLCAPKNGAWVQAFGLLSRFSRGCSLTARVRIWTEAIYELTLGGGPPATDSPSSSSSRERFLVFVGTVDVDGA